MAIDFSIMVYLPAQDVFGRSVTFTPLASQPGAPAYTLRGIITTRPLMVETTAGMAVLSDQETILDIREREFAVTPKQGDLIDVPEENGITDMVGSYEVTDAAWNGGGEVTLSLRRLVTTAP
jgi:hypothetical protein